MAKPESRSRLGRGLGAILGEYMDETALTDAPVREVDLAQVRPNPFQPRRGIDEASLDELEASIRQNGLLQPLVVRPSEPGWELVAGERRWRVLRRLGWRTAPTIIRELNDEQMLVLALVENLQREDLGPLEEAVGYQQLIDGFGLTQRDVATQVGRDRSTISNALRLLTLPPVVQEMLGSGELTAGHARAVLSVEGETAQVALARDIVKRGLSVREAERRSRRLRQAEGKPAPKKGEPRVDPVARKAETLLARAFGTAVTIRLRGRTTGEIRIPFHDSADFERVARLLLSEADSAEVFDER